MKSTLCAQTTGREFRTSSHTDCNGPTESEPNPYSQVTRTGVSWKLARERWKLGEDHHRYFRSTNLVETGNILDDSLRGGGHVRQVQERGGLTHHMRARPLQEGRSLRVGGRNRWGKSPQGGDRDRWGRSKRRGVFQPCPAASAGNIEFVMRFLRSSNWNGLTTTSVMPAFKYCRRSWSKALAVTAKIGLANPRARRRRAASSPLMCGMTISISTTSGCFCSTTSMALRPSTASNTVNPALRNRRQRMWRSRASSSTTTTTVPGFTTGDWGGARSKRMSLEDLVGPSPGSVT
mmetsp:Transcript_35406/g.80872  ORF Transcript_35406/g.80872 Transcript_35406/m.80872 type:complete len:292 (+) Transcript_35406:476-1351(+)